MEKTKKEKEVKETKTVIVRGYLRPDKTSYYVSIPKEIRQVLGLKGGEYFVMRAKKAKQRITLRLVEFSDEE